MVGDNEESDLKGAKAAGWDTILVKTGVTKHDCEFATINADSLHQGIDMYLKWVGEQVIERKG